MRNNQKLLIKLALLEDAPRGDSTTEPLGLGAKKGRALLIAKQEMVLSGTEMFSETFRSVSKKCRVKWFVSDGQKVASRQKLASVEGPLWALLKAERVALNFLGPLCGIATLTNQFVQEVKGTGAKITDTRKTRPLYRELEKKAVVDGGGTNHRMNLSDQILVKENHIRAGGNIPLVISALRKAHPKIFLEVEVATLKELKTVLSLQNKYKIQRVMLDNMSLSTMRHGIALIQKHIHLQNAAKTKNDGPRQHKPKKLQPKKLQIEASGNMSLQRVRAVAKLGVDFISIGKITHSAPNADLSLLFEMK
jgi:nicotinate-nucleotide pyrophosphorylase (carboxylating)